jgi:ribosome assembly protein 1
MEALPAILYDHVPLCPLPLAEQVNAITSSFVLGRAMAEAAAVTPVVNGAAAAASVPDSAPASAAGAQYQFDIDETEELAMQFSPLKGNVLFSSAFDSWAFSLADFAVFYSKKLGMSAKALQKCLWGDFYFQAKTQSVSTKPNPKNPFPMFVQFIMEPIAALYHDLLVDQVCVGGCVSEWEMHTARIYLNVRTCVRGVSCARTCKKCNT